MTKFRPYRRELGTYNPMGSPSRKSPPASDAQLYADSRSAVAEYAALSLAGKTIGELAAVYASGKSENHGRSSHA